MSGFKVGDRVTYSAALRASAHADWNAWVAERPMVGTVVRVHDVSEARWRGWSWTVRVRIDGSAGLYGFKPQDLAIVDGAS